MIQTTPTLAAADICLADVDDQAALEYCASNAKNSIPVDEIQYADRLEAVGRRRFLVSRMTLRQLIARHTNTAIASRSFSYQEGGKPYLRDGPHFSLSRHGSKAIFVVATTHPVGVDLESHRAVELAPDWTRRYASLATLVEICQRDGLSGARAFMHGWVRFEAMAKCQGRQIRLELDRTSIFHDELSVESWDINGGLVAGLASRGNLALHWFDARWDIQSGPYFVAAERPK